MMRSFELILLVIVGLVSETPAQAQRPVVDVAGGRLVGETIDFDQEDILGVNTQVDLFLGVPFADPPVRFASPVPKTPWDGEWNATYFRDSCSHIITDPLQRPASEDCLYLNVFAPNPRSDNVPVMVFLPGGAFKIGGASNPKYAGTSLAASSDLIVVTVGYRVGVFGIFTTGDDVAPGNYAMLDQVAALHWVHDNIAAFGGNRDEVTIFGQSSGAGSVGFHLLSPLSAGLFSRAILQSGSALSPRYFRHDPDLDRQQAADLAAAVGCVTTDSASIVACLRTTEESTLLQVQDSIYTSGYFIRDDGAFLEDTPHNLLFGQNPTPLRPAAILAGFNSQEGTASVRTNFPEYTTSETGPAISHAKYESMVTGTLLGQDRNSLTRDSVSQEYVDWTRADYPDLDYFDAYVDYYGDYIWRSGSDATLRRYYEFGVTNLYQYLFSHTPSSSFYRSGPTNPTWLGAGHTEELQFAFGWSFDEDILRYKYELTEEEKGLSADMMRMWTNFAKTGDPTRATDDISSDPELPNWPRFTVPELRYLDLNLASTRRRAVQASGMAFWNRYIPEIRKVTESQMEEELEWRENYITWQNDMEEWRTLFKDYNDRPSCP